MNFFKNYAYFWKIKILSRGFLKIAQSCLTLWDPMDYRVHGILQARIPERVAVPFLRGSSQPRDWTQVSRIAGRFFTSWTTYIKRVCVTHFLEILKKYLCILGLCWVLLLLRLLSSCGKQQLLSGCCAQASHRCGLFCCRARSVQHKLNSCGTQA